MPHIDVRRLYAWWIDELAKTLTPARKAQRGWKTLVSSTATGIEVRHKHGSSVVQLGTLGPDAKPSEVAGLKKRVARSVEANAKDVLLRLSEADVVERVIQIPKAATDVIGPVVRNQLERIAPWPEAETCFGYRIVGVNEKSPGHLDVRIVATSRKIMDAKLAEARSLGLEPWSVEFASASDPEGQNASSLVELMSMAPDPKRRTAEILRGALAALVVGCAAIGGFGAYLVWDRQSQRDELAERIALVSARVEVSRQLTQRNAELRRQHTRLIGQKTASPAVMVLIERLSEALPDTAYLTELEIHDREARIIGKSENSTGLIPVLEETSEFGDVRFSAPTTREEGESMETFSIIAKIEGRALREGSP